MYKFNIVFVVLLSIMGSNAMALDCCVPTPYGDGGCGNIPICTNHGGNYGGGSSGHDDYGMINS